MEQFDFDCPVELYMAAGRGMSRQTMNYKRFSTGAEAVRYAIEVIGKDKLGGIAIETETARFGAVEIRALYLHDDYPLRRHDA